MESRSSSPLSDAPSDITDYHLPVEVGERLNGYVPDGAQDDTKSFLETTFQFLPKDGKKNLEADIRGCQSDAELRTLANHIDTALIRPLKTVGGRTKPVTPSPRYGTEHSVEDLASQIQDSAVREQKQLRKEGLARDNNRCVLTNQLNEDLPSPSQPELVGKLIAAHIIPFSMGSFASEDGRYELAAMWQSLYRYFPGVRERLSASTINNISNVMMLEDIIHIAFGTLNIALEPLPESNKYRIFQTYTGNKIRYFTSLLPSDGIVTLVSHDPRYPLPDRTLLETHYLVARILHATGRGEVVEKILREYSETGGMSSDGTTDISQMLSVTSLGPLLHGCA